MQSIRNLEQNRKFIWRFAIS